MSVVHTFRGVQAPVRGDAEVWTQVRVEESVDKVAFTTAATMVLVPPETDPALPVPDRTITFESLDASIWFRLVWIDVDGDVSPPTDWVSDDSYVADPEWMPTPEEVAPLVRARLKNTGGAEVATFTDSGTTRPSRSQVLELIRQAVGDVQARVGTVPPILESIAKYIAALGTAMLIELSFFPEQVAQGRSPYDQYEKMYDKRIAALIEAAEEIAATGDILPGTTEDGETLQSNMPVFAFDTDLQVGQVYW